MSLLDRLEKRLGSWAIPNFPLFIVAANGLIYLLALIRSDFLYRLVIDLDAIRQGEFWRLITFLFVPPMFGPIGMAFWLYLLYIYAQALETEWGSFRFCVFYGIGGLAMMAAAFWTGENLSNVPLNTTLFLAFATL